MKEAEKAEVLGDNQIVHRDARAFRDYQLWSGEVTPRQNEWARRAELVKMCQGVSYNRDMADAWEDGFASLSGAITEIRDEERYCGLEISPAEDRLDIPVRIVRVDDLMTELDNQTGGVM